MGTTDTIVAIATPVGEGGLGVVRLSGPLGLSIASLLFCDPRLSSAPTHTLHHGWIHDKDSIVDDAVAAVFRAPRSYTGEDVVELSCHGSPAILKRVVRLCEAAGARAAQPGEFTQRAFLNGKMDLVQAEAVAELISARSATASATASAQLRGVLSERLRGLRAGLVDLLARIEANLDFVEEDIPGLPRAEMRAALTKVSNGVEDLLATSLRGRVLRHGLRVAIAGKPNVGKSSLFNALLAQERAIVSDAPGTTRDTLEEQVEWNGMPVALTDTAGLRETADVVERSGTDRARRAASDSDVVIFVVDGSRPLDEDDEAVAKSLSEKKIVVALNKADLGSVAREEDVRGMARIQASVEVSARSGHGLARLRDAVAAAVGSGFMDPAEGPVLTNARHAQHLEKAQQHLRRALEIADHESEEALAFVLREALAEISAVTGDSLSEDVIASIFRQFCIGK